MHSANIEPKALDGLLIGQAIRQFAFDDPAVQAIRNTLRYSKKQTEAFESLFENGFFLWPLHASADDLARILYPAITDRPRRGARDGGSAGKGDAGG